MVRLRLETKVLKFKHSYFSSHIHNEEVVLVAKSMKLIGTTYSFPRMNGTGNPHRPNCEREREREGLEIEAIIMFVLLSSLSRSNLEVKRVLSRHDPPSTRVH